jgi:ethanolamine utilization protein EutA (predicted chaperonin)
VTQPDVEMVIAGQAALIAALDAGDVAAIEAATATLGTVLAALRARGVVGDEAGDRIDYALRQSDAARTRVNYLADRTRQRLDRLAARRGVTQSPVYTTRGRLSVFGG